MTQDVSGVPLFLAQPKAIKMCQDTTRRGLFSLDARQKRGNFALRRLGRVAIFRFAGERPSKNKS